MKVFQFPSNGKVFPNSTNHRRERNPRSMVSIPFKREGLSERMFDYPRTTEVLVSIPFKREGLSEQVRERILPRLRTIVSIPFKREGLSERSAHHPKGVGSKVSIPFKREGLSEQAVKEWLKEKERKLFQFPSNGKVFPNLPPCEPSHSRG